MHIETRGIGQGDILSHELLCLDMVEVGRVAVVGDVHPNLPKRGTNTR